MSERTAPSQPATHSVEASLPFCFDCAANNNNHNNNNHNNNNNNHNNNNNNIIIIINNFEHPQTILQFKTAPGRKIKQTEWLLCADFFYLELISRFCPLKICWFRHLFVFALPAHLICFCSSILSKLIGYYALRNETLPGRFRGPSGRAPSVTKGASPSAKHALKVRFTKARGLKGTWSLPKVKAASRGLKGAWKGLQGSLKRASPSKGFKGLEGSLKGASKGLEAFNAKETSSGLLRYYFTHVQTCNVTRVQSTTECMLWYTLHMSKPAM